MRPDQLIRTAWARLVSLESPTLQPTEVLVVKTLTLSWLMTMHVGLIAEPTGLWPEWTFAQKAAFGTVWISAQVFVSAAVLLSRRTALASGLMAALLFIGFAISRPYHANNRLFFACVLTCAALSSAGSRFRPLRWQYVLLFLGSGLDKLFNDDWRSGRFLSNLADHVLTFGSLWAPGNRVGDPNVWLHAALDALTPGLSFWTALSAAVIVAELGTALLLIIRPGFATLPAVMLMCGIGMFGQSSMGMFVYLGLSTVLLTAQSSGTQLRFSTRTVNASVVFAVWAVMSGPWFHGWVLQVGFVVIAAVTMVLAAQSLRRNRAVAA